MNITYFNYQKSEEIRYYNHVAAACTIESHYDFLQIIHLELVEIDEVNLNAILMLGAHCINLKKLCLHGCHFQMQPEDAITVDSLCQSRFQTDKGN